jgi:hypothetical protein
MSPLVRSIIQATFVCKKGEKCRLYFGSHVANQNGSITLRKGGKTQNPALAMPPLAVHITMPTVFPAHKTLHSFPGEVPTFLPVSSLSSELQVAHKRLLVTQHPIERQISVPSSPLT